MHPSNSRWPGSGRTSLLRTCVEVAVVLALDAGLVALAWFGLGTRDFVWSGVTSPSGSSAAPMTVTPGGPLAEASAGFHDVRAVVGPPPAEDPGAPSTATATVDGGVVVAVVVGAGVVCSVLTVPWLVRRHRRAPSAAAAAAAAAEGGPGSDVPAPPACEDEPDRRESSGPAVEQVGSAAPPLPSVGPRPDPSQRGAGTEPDAVDDVPAPRRSGAADAAGVGVGVAAEGAGPRRPHPAPEPGHLAPRERESSRVTLVDRRASRRTEIQRGARLRWRTDDLEVLVTDVSESGAACSLPSSEGRPRTDLPKFGHVVQLVLPLGTGVVDTAARVQWVTSTGGEVRWGLQFTGMSPEAREVVRGVVRAER